MRYVLWNDICDDVEYTYTLDAYAGVLKGSVGVGRSLLLTFETLRAGGTFLTAETSIDDLKAKVLDICRTRLSTDDFNARKAAIVANMEESLGRFLGMTDDDWARDYLE